MNMPLYYFRKNTEKAAFKKEISEYHSSDMINTIYHSLLRRKDIITAPDEIKGFEYGLEMFKDVITEYGIIINDIYTEPYLVFTEEENDRYSKYSPLSYLLNKLKKKELSPAFAVKYGPKANRGVMAVALTIIGVTGKYGFILSDDVKSLPERDIAREMLGLPGTF